MIARGICVQGASKGLENVWNFSVLSGTPDNGTVLHVVLLRKWQNWPVVQQYDCSYVTCTCSLFILSSPCAISASYILKH